MGARLSLFRGSAAKTDDKEVSQEVKTEVTPPTPSQPTPITSESATEDKNEPKCQCIDCKCDPCNCPHDRPQEQTSPQTPTNELSDKTGGDAVNETLVTPLEEMKITETAETEKPNEVVVAEEPQVIETESPEQPKPEEVPQQVIEDSTSEKSDDTVPSDAQSQEIPHSEVVKQVPPTETVAEKKCLCSPCECNPCKCGPECAHEVHPEVEIPRSEDNTKEPVIQAQESAEVQTSPEMLSPEDSSAPEVESKAEKSVEATEIAEQIQSEPTAEEPVSDCAAEADQMLAESEVPPEVSQALDLQTNEQ